MRRGFKTEAGRVGQQIRSELGLNQLQPLDPWRLADHLDVPVLSITDLHSDAPDCVQTLTGSERSAFSAMVAFVGRRQTIVHNDSHAITRQRSNLCHELAHVLLIHQPHPARPGEPLGYDADQEEEATWLGAVLLAPDQACLNACRNRHSVEAAAKGLGISPSLMQWRINASGSEARVRRERHRR
jgi:IrrE N-terminal-like domain